MKCDISVIEALNRIINDDSMSKLIASRLTEDARKDIIGFFNLFNKTFDNLKLDPDELDIKNVFGWLNVIRQFVGYRNRESDGTLSIAEEDKSISFLKMIMGGKENVKELEDAILQKVSVDATNADKLSAFVEVSYAYVKQFKGNLGIGGVADEEIDEDMEYTTRVIKNNVTNKDAQNKREREIILPSGNSASIFGKRGVQVSLNLYYPQRKGEHPSAYQLMQLDNVFKALTYIKAVYAYGIDSVHSEKNGKVLLNEIRNMSNDDIVSFYNDMVIKDEKYAEEYKKNVPWILSELIAKSFMGSYSVNPTELRNAIQFLKSNIPSTEEATAIYKNESSSSSESSKLIDLYNAIISQNAPEYVDMYGDTEKKVTIHTTAITLDELISNPHRLYVISGDSPLAGEIKKYEESNGTTIENVTVVPKTMDISNDEDDSFGDYHTGINKDTDGVMVFSSSKYGYGTKTAKEAKEQGRLRTPETPEESPTNRMTFNQKGFALETIDSDGKSLNRESVIKNIRKLYYAARTNKNKKFLIPYEERGLVKTDTGYSGDELIEMFVEAGGEKGIPENIIFSFDWASSDEIMSQNFKNFIRKKVIPTIKKDADKISGVNPADIIIDKNSFDMKEGEENAYNTYLMSIFGKMAGETKALDEKTASLIAIKERKSSIEKVNSVLDSLKRSVFNDMIYAINAKKSERTTLLGETGELSDVIPFLLLEANSSIPIKIEGTNSVKHSMLTEAAHNVEAFIINNGPTVLNHMLGGNKAMYEVLREKASNLYHVGKVTSQTKTALYMPPREFFANAEEYNRVLNQVVSEARRILDSGGSIVTLSNRVMSNKTLVYQRTEESNKDIWNELYKLGYKPEYSPTGVDVWTSKVTLSEEDQEKYDEKLKSLKEKLQELKHFTPSVSNYEKDGTLSSTIVLSNSMFNTLSTSVENGMITFSKSDPLYDEIFAIGERLVNRENNGTPLRCNINIPATGSTYYAQITSDNMLVNPDESLSIVADFKTIRNIQDYSDVDTSLFDNLNAGEITIKNDNLKLKLGAKKYNSLTSNIVKSLGVDLYDFAQQDMEDYQSKINEINEQLLKMWTTNTSSMSKDEKKAFSKKKKELKREVLKYTRIIRKLQEGDYVEYLNNWEYTDNNGKKWTGVLGFARQSLDSKYGEYATMEEGSEEFNKKVEEKYSNILNLYLEKNADVDPKTFHVDKEKIHDKAVEIVQSAISASNTILANIDEFLSISFKRFGRKYGLKINTQVTLDKSTTPNMTAEKVEDSNFNSEEENTNEDFNSEIEEDGVKFLDNYQAETKDIKKSLSQQVKELLETVFVRNDDKITGFMQLDEMGEILYQNPDNVYNFLREHLTGIDTYKEMENWIGNYVKQGHFEYGDLLYFLTSSNDNTRTKFFVAMHTQAVQRVSGTIDKFGVDKLYDDNKDMKMKKFSDMTALCIGSRQRLVPKEAEEFNFIGATGKDSLERSVKIADKLTSLSKKFKEGNDKFNKTNKDSNIFLSQNEEDVVLINEVVDTLTNTLMGIGIPVSQKMIRDSITSPKEFFLLIKTLTDRTKGFFPNISKYGRSAEITEYENRKYDYQNIFEIISTALYDTPQKGTIHANGKDYASYMYPSFSSLLFDKLNDNSKDEDGRRKNMKFIEERFMRLPLFYKEDNLDVIRTYLERDTDKYGNLLLQIDEEAIKEEVRKSFIDQEAALEGTEGYVFTNRENKNEYVNDYDAIPKYLKTNKRKEIVKDILSKSQIALPDGCPIYQNDIWRNEWLKTIYKNFSNITHNSKKEKWEKIQTSYLTALNKKEYKNLTKAEHEQFLISSFLTTCNRTKFKFGAFYSPMVSDAEVCRMETFALMDGMSEVADEANKKGLLPIALLAAKKLKKVVEAEIEMSDALLKRYILRLEAYNEYNRRISNGEDIKYSDCEGYSEPIGFFDIEEARTFKRDANGKYLIDLDGLTFDKFGKLDLEKSRDAIFGINGKGGRITKLNAYKPSHYVNIDPNSGLDLETQCYNELIKQFAIYLESLNENTTVPTKGGNISIFQKSEKEGSENYTDSFYESEEESEEESTEDEDNEDEDNFLSDFVSEEDFEASRSMEEVLAEKRKENAAIRTTSNNVQDSSGYEKIKNYEIFKYVSSDAMPLIARFFFEQAYANTQLQQLLNTSPAFYKAGNVVEVQKRGKEHNTPMIRLDLSRLESPIQKSIVLKDIIMDSEYEEIKEIVENSENLSKSDKEDILKAFEDMTITDGQAYRSPTSYKKIMQGLGRWPDITEAAFNKLMYTNEPITSADIHALVMNPIKGFNFSMEEVNLTPDYKILKPTQYKDSEAVLLYAAFAKRRKSNKGSLVEQGSVLSGLVEFMEENDIDCAVFESCVKEGCQGAIDITSASTAEEAKLMLYNACFNSNKEERDEVVHKTSWADYGIVSETPEHFYEEEAVFGTQIRRILNSDLIADRLYNIKDPLTGKPLSEKGMTGRQIMDKYSGLIGEVLYDSFNELKDLFDNNDKLEDFLLREVSGNPLYPSDISDYCKYNRKTGEFDKLGNPKNYAKTQQLLLSLFKNRITRQKISGGSCVQVSVSYMSEGLKVKFQEVEDAYGKIRKVPIESECLLPAYMEPIYEKFLLEDGTIDFEAMQDYYKNDPVTFNALTSMVGYRIPTEGLSSTIKLKVVGFTNNYTGSSIILPKEIVTFSGSDFDIDKMYIHRFEFAEDKDGYPILLTKDNYDENDPEDRKIVANNELVKLMMGIMTLPENAMLMVKPQGFDNLKKSACIANIIKQPDNKLSISELRKMPLSELKKLAKFDSGLSFLNPATQTYFQQQNMVGKNSLGIWAVARSGHCLFENSGIFLKPEYSFVFNGQNVMIPDQITVNRNGVEMYLSPEIGSFVGASADNAKDPVLAKLGITPYNIDVAVYLIRMGLDSTSMALMLQNQFFSINQFTPVLAYFDKIFSRKVASRESTSTEEFEVKLEEYHKNMMLDRETVLGIQYTDDLFAEINSETDAVDLESVVTVKYKTRSGEVVDRKFTKAQIAYAIASLGRDVVAPAKDQLNQLTLALRADSQNGAAKAGMAGTCSRIQQIEAAELVFESAISVFNFDEKFNKSKFFKTDFDASKKFERSDREVTNIGYVQDFIDYGVLAIRELTKGKMPHFGATFSNAFKIGKHMKNRFISEKNAKALEAELFYYHFGNIPFFGNETVEENGVKKEIKREDKIKLYKDGMCALYWQTIASHPELLDNKFISMLRPDPPLSEDDKKMGKIQVLRMPGSNQLEDEAKTDLGIAFLEILKNDDPAIRKFGEHLVRYSFYRQGFRFLPDGYMNIIPNEVFESLKGYNEVLRGLITTNEDEGLKNGNFIEQFLLNNLSAIKALNQIYEAELAENPEMLSTPEKIIEKFGYIPKYICTKSKAGYALKRFNSNTGNYVYARIHKEKSLAQDNKYFVEYTYFPSQKFIDIDVDPANVKSKKKTYSSYFEEQLDSYYNAAGLIGQKGEYNGLAYDKLGKAATERIYANMQSALGVWLNEGEEKGNDNDRLNNIGQSSDGTTQDGNIEVSCKL